MLDLTNPEIIKELLAEQGLRVKKDLGQHFLLSRKIIGKIIKAAQLKKTDTVLEIGPGLGVLTVELAKHVKLVIAVEKDEKLVQVLQNNLKTEKLKNVEVVSDDILKFSPNKLLTTNYKLISNLPYQITSPILWKFLHEEKFKPELLVLMLQKEVAARVTAKPGNMSLLSVLVQYYTAPSVVVQVKRTLFYPPPKVDSTVLKFQISNFKFQIDEKKLFKLVKSGFKSKRKTLRNNIRVLNLSNPTISAALNKINLSEKCRAQELSIADWLNLYKMLYNEK